MARGCTQGLKNHLGTLLTIQDRPHVLVEAVRQRLNLSAFGGVLGQAGVDGGGAEAANHAVLAIVCHAIVTQPTTNAGQERLYLLVPLHLCGMVAAAPSPGHQPLLQPGRCNRLSIGLWVVSWRQQTKGWAYREGLHDISQ